MLLTELQIKRLPFREGRYAVSDGRGLALEMMPTGATAWRYRYQLHGRPVQPLWSKSVHGRNWFKSLALAFVGLHKIDNH